MWMTEQPLRLMQNLKTIHRPRHAYTIIRSPTEHVISQYHHCKESKDHEQYAHLMPSFDEWIDHHVERLTTVNRTSNRVYRKFYCFDPINLQSFFTNFWGNTTEDYLRDRFDVIGDMAQLGKSICAISIRYSGYVPPACDCTNQNKHRRLSTDHGVQHHGATFNLTDEQSEKIAKLTQLDSILYERTKNVFSVQVKEIEDEMGIILCQEPSPKALKLK